MLEALSLVVGFLGVAAAFEGTFIGRGLEEDLTTFFAKVLLATGFLRAFEDPEFLVFTLLDVLAVDFTLFRVFFSKNRTRIRQIRIPQPVKKSINAHF